MIGFILVIHSIVCVLLVLAILMQSGRGGGLTEQFASAESVFGAQTSSFMVRVTSILAAVFFVTSLSLAFLSARRETSLMTNQGSVKTVSKLDSMTIPKQPVSDAGQSMDDAIVAVDKVMPIAQDVADDVMGDNPSVSDVLTPVIANIQK